MFHVEQFRRLIVRPTLEEMGAWSIGAENLLIGTCAQETEMGCYLKQLGNGPALGIYQMEPATYDDIWKNYLNFNPKKAQYVERTDIPEPEVMIYDLKFATQMARFHYLRVSEAIPQTDNPEELGKYWKKYYNTIKGKGTVEEFVKNYMLYAV